MKSAADTERTLLTVVAKPSSVLTQNRHQPWIVVELKAWKLSELCSQEPQITGDHRDAAALGASVGNDSA